MLWVGKNQCHKNGHTAQSNLQFQCFPHQANIDRLHQTGKKNFKLYMEPKESPHTITLPDFKLYCKATVIKQHGTGTKTEMQFNGTEQRPQK